jgi:putative membrane protein
VLPGRPLLWRLLGLTAWVGALQACSTPGAGRPGLGPPALPALVATGAAPAGAAAAADTPAPLSENDRRFVMEAAASGLYRVEVARLASQRSTHPMVKAYAALLVQQQGTANEELRALAVRRRFIWPGGPPAPRVAELTALQALDGEAFDQRFVQQTGIADHQADVLLFEAASRHLDDRQLRAWAERMLPTLQNHLVMARQLPAVAKA